jgi:hypothetical protein
MKAPAMTSLTLFEQTQLPAYAIAAGNAPDAFMGGTVTGPSYPRIGLRNNAFWLKKDGNETATNSPHLDFALIAAEPHVSRVYFGTKYAQGVKAESPKCQSHDGVAPDSTSPAPQSVSCKGCPQNQKGSSENGGKACAFKKTLVVADLASADAGNPQAAILTLNGSTIYGESYPDRKVFAFGDMMAMAKQHRIDPRALRLRAQFDPTGQSKLVFSLAPDGGYLTMEAMRASAALAADPSIQKMLASDTPAPVVSVLPAPAPAPKPSPAPVAPPPTPKPLIKELTWQEKLTAQGFSVDDTAMVEDLGGPTTDAAAKYLARVAARKAAPPHVPVKAPPAPAVAAGHDALTSQLLAFGYD